LQDRALGLLGGAAELRERGLHQVETDADLTDGRLITGDGVELRSQPDGQAAVEAEPRVGRGLQAGAELTLKIIELIAHLADGLQRQRRTRSYARHAHLRPHIFNSASIMSRTAVITRALAP
jgi:hypothetical protein